MIRVSPKLKHWEIYEDNAKFFLIFSFSFRMSRAKNEKKNALVYIVIIYVAWCQKHGNYMNYFIPSHWLVMTYIHMRVTWCFEFGIMWIVSWTAFGLARHAVATPYLTSQVQNDLFKYIVTRVYKLALTFKLSLLGNLKYHQHSDVTDDVSWKRQS